MPKPPGTYLHSQQKDKVAANVAKAGDTQRQVATAVDKERQRFYAALDKLSESKLRTWNKAMDALATAVKKNDLMSKEDRVRKAVAEVIGEVRKVLEQKKDLGQLEASLQRPAQAVIHAPASFGSAGVELGLIIALCKVLEVLVRLRGKRDRD